jgi:hypothetical protein
VGQVVTVLKFGPFTEQYTQVRLRVVHQLRLSGKQSDTLFDVG